MRCTVILTKPTLVTRLPTTPWHGSTATLSLAEVTRSRSSTSRPRLELALKNHVKATVGPWKYPRWIEIVDEFSVTVCETASRAIRYFRARNSIKLRSFVRSKWVDRAADWVAARSAVTGETVALVPSGGIGSSAPANGCIQISADLERITV
jgi:hypothetical protein